MDYLIIENGTITNVIVCDSDEIAEQFGAVPYYDGAGIGGEYNPPEIPAPAPEPTTEDIINTMLGVIK